MIYIGIDPGKAGALAEIDEAGLVRSVVAIPLVSPGGKGRDEYDLHTIATVLKVLREHSPDGQVFATVEKSQPLPPAGFGKGGVRAGGSFANFGRGVARGWEWMLVGLGIGYQLVGPRTWQRLMHAGTPDTDTKVRSIMAAHRLFPAVDLRRTQRSRNDDDGLAEALLLAEYGRRTHQGKL